MAPKKVLRENPSSASSSSRGSGSSTDDSGSSEYETTEDAAAKPNGKPVASSGKAPSQETKHTKTPVSSSEFDSESTDDESVNPGGKLGGSSSKMPPSQASQNKQQTEDESGSDSETESSEGKAVIERDQKPKPRLESIKREAEKTPDPKSSKRAKTAVDEKKRAIVSIQDSEKKIPFQRVFSESDDIEVLKGAVEYEEQKKGNEVHDGNVFYDFIKMRIETTFTKAQLLKKLQSLKKRFPVLENRIHKGLKTLKPLDPIIYELSKKLWGSGGLLEKTEKELVSENSTPSRKLLSSSTKLTEKPNPEFISHKPNGVKSWYLSETLGVCHKGGVDPEYMKEVMNSIDECERTELESRWRKNQAAMARVMEERLMISQQVCKLVEKHSSSSS